MKAAVDAFVPVRIKGPFEGRPSGDGVERAQLEGTLIKLLHAPLPPPSPPF